jgi:hypothetical protein
MIHCAMKSKSDTALIDVYGVCNHRISRSGANAFTDTIGESNCQDVVPSRCECQ